jgi:dTMP kinase
MNINPLFIVIEGIDGCGKSTQLYMLKSAMAGAGRKVAVVHDPGTTEVGIALRKLLLDGDVEMPPEIQTLLYTAARASLARHIGDLRRGGIDVICGRWVMSTLIYQGSVQKVGPLSVQRLHDRWVKLNPDVYVVLDLPGELGQERLFEKRSRNGDDCGASGSLGEVGAAPEFDPGRDRFESKGVEFAENLRAGYRIHGEDMSNAWIVDATGTPDEVHDRVKAACALKSAQFARLFGGHHEPAD